MRRLFIILFAALVAGCNGTPTPAPAPTATPSPYLCHTQTRLRGVRLCYEGPHGLSRCLAAVVEAAGERSRAAFPTAL